MRYEQIASVFDTLDEGRITYWVAGGWGIALLVGRQTRAHRDLDLFVDAEQLDDCLGLLDGLGYVVETDWLPTRIELAGPDDAWVDLHPLRFDADGCGRLVLLDGTDLTFPPDAFTTGTLHGRDRLCLSADRQRLVHDGYPPRPEDLHDLAQLDSLSGVSPTPSGARDGPPTPSKTRDGSPTPTEAHDSSPTPTEAHDSSRRRTLGNTASEPLT